mmetsp:Transcript_5259/g.10818  ORF Transcript_5259/g.10818 Transcript_5259/m.10818 type:complete len:152 (-) Transcript_5259:79-534(-)
MATKAPALVQDNFLLAFAELTGIMIFRFPLKWAIWIQILIFTNMIAGVYFIETLEGKLAVGIFNMGAFTMTYLYQRLGFVKVLGIGHVGWIFLVPWILLERLPLTEDGSLFQYWLYALITVNSLCLYLDVKDVKQYLVDGKSTPTLKWKKE